MNNFEKFVDQRISVVSSMVEGEEKEKAIRNLVEVVKAETDAERATYANSIEMAKLDSSETMEKERLEQAKEIEVLRLEQAKELEKLRLDQNKELEILRIAHEMDLEKLRGEFGKERAELEKSSKGEKALQYLLQVVQIAVPTGLFMYATKRENEDGFLPGPAKTLLTKLPFFRK